MTNTPETTSQPTKGEAAEKSPRKPSAKARNMSARLLASQAVFQASLNQQALAAVAEEFLEHRLNMQIGDEEIVEPNKQLFSRIVRGVETHKADLSAVLQAQLKDGAQRTETLVRSILMCAGYELLSNLEVDSPIIINDYLNVAHAFFEKGEVGFINGVLDNVAKALRD